MRGSNGNNFFASSFWRYTTNIWTLVFIALVLANFLTAGKYQYLMAPFSVIYGAVLSIFVGTKEFSRWYDINHKSQHPGELFVILWTIALLFMLIYAWIGGESYKISNEVISVYIMVLTVFAITQSSKTIYRKKRIGVRNK